MDVGLGVVECRGDRHLLDAHLGLRQRCVGDLAIRWRLGLHGHPLREALAQPGRRVVVVLGDRDVGELVAHEAVEHGAATVEDRRVEGDTRRDHAPVTGACRHRERHCVEAGGVLARQIVQALEEAQVGERVEDHGAVPGVRHPSSDVGDASDHRPQQPPLVGCGAAVEDAEHSGRRADDNRAHVPRLTLHIVGVLPCAVVDRAEPVASTDHLGETEAVQGLGGQRVEPVELHRERDDDPIAAARPHQARPVEGVAHLLQRQLQQVVEVAVLGVEEAGVTGVEAGDEQVAIASQQRACALVEQPLERTAEVARHRQARDRRRRRHRRRARRALRGRRAGPRADRRGCIVGAGGARAQQERERNYEREQQRQQPACPERPTRHRVRRGPGVVRSGRRHRPGRHCRRGPSCPRRCRGPAPGR